MLFHLFQDNHVGFYVYITANYRSLLSAGVAKAGRSEEVVAQLTSCMTLFRFLLRRFVAWMSNISERAHEYNTLQQVYTDFCGVKIIIRAYGLDGLGDNFCCELALYK